VRYEERGQGYRDVEKVGKHCVSGWFHFMLFVVLCVCWFRLCCMLSWGAT